VELVEVFTEIAAEIIVATEATADITADVAG